MAGGARVGMAESAEVVATTRALRDRRAWFQATDTVMERVLLRSRVCRSDICQLTLTCGAW